MKRHRLKIAASKIRPTMPRIFLGMVVALFIQLPAYADSAPPAVGPIAVAAAAPAPRRAQFHGQAAPQSVRQMADWVTDSRDNASLPFVIIDKRNAKVFVFEKDGKLVGSAWALVGLERGDDSVPGIGTMPLKEITPEMRTTPAGRFVAGLGHDLGTDVLWVDYGLAVSLHRVINTNLAERRLERIVSPSPSDHRISFGCINVPADFFDGVVKPAFQNTKGVVYILPEVKPMGAVFPAYYEVGDHSKSLSASKTANPVSATPVAYQDGARSVDDHELAGVVH